MPTSSNGKSSVNIDPFATVAGHITVAGQEHDVLHLNGREYRTLRSGADALAAYDIVLRIVPTLSEDEVYSLTAPQIGAIIAVADGQVVAVEKQFPNAEGPVMTSPTTSPA
jgi:hypothetical protein